MRRWIIGALVLMAAGCSNTSTSALSSPSPSPTSVSPSVSPSPLAGDVCNDAPLIGEIAHVVKKGTETADELVAHIQDVETTLEADSSAITDPDGQKAMGDLLDTLGSLKREVSSAGDSYPFDAVVKLRMKSMQLTALTVAVTLCL